MIIESLELGRREAEAGIADVGLNSELPMELLMLVLMLP